MSTDTPDLQAHGDLAPHGEPDSQHDSGASGHEEHHGLTDMQYVGIFVFLAVVTGAEVVLSYWQPGVFFLPLLLSMMVVKFFVVVLFFMHLRFDNRLFAVLFYLGLSLAVFVYTVALFTFHFFSGS